MLWYSSAGADASLTGLGAGRVPAHYHHLYYHGPAPHEHHSSPYDEFPPASSASSPDLPHFDEAEADPRAARHHSEGAAAAPPSHYPPAAYHHHQQQRVGGGADDGWEHEVPRWMVGQGREGWAEAERMMAGNTAQQKLLRQMRRNAEEAERAKHLQQERE